MSTGLADNITISLVANHQGQHQIFDVLDLSFTTRIHQDYEIVAHVVSSDQSKDAFATQGCFTTGMWYAVEVRFERHDKLMYLQGVCTELVGTGKYANDREIQIITLCSALYPLFTNQRTGVYYGGSVRDVIDQGLVALIQKNAYERAY